MSDQAVIDLYIQDLASTTHQLYQEKAANQDLASENGTLKSENASLSGENSTLKQEIATLQAKYDAIKSGAGAPEVVAGTIVPDAPEAAPTPHF